jgi:SAM-dependent methyltransferase
LIFEPYALDLASRVAELAPERVLEVAAGTGVVTRFLSHRLDADITATDLNQPMVDRAAAIGTYRPVSWRAADVMALPFEDASFDVVVCQFGVMFFPDRAAAYREIGRVLRPGGTFLFNTWDRIEANEFADAVTDAVATVFPDDSPRFLARTPHGYHDRTVIEGDLVSAGVAITGWDALEARSVAAESSIPAIAYCQGTPLRNEIDARDPSRLAEATEVATAVISDRFGTGPIDGLIRGYVVAAVR